METIYYSHELCSTESGIPNISILFLLLHYSSIFWPVSREITLFSPIYDIISVPQITWFLLEDAIISSKTDPRRSSRTEKRTYGKVRNNKTM